LTVTVAPGASSATVFYDDTAAGGPVVTAMLDGGASQSQTETVTGAASLDSASSGGSGGSVTAETPTTPPTQPAAMPIPPAATVAKPKPAQRVATVTKHFVAGHLVVAVHVASGRGHPSGIHVRIRVRLGSSTVANVERVTAKGGIATWRSTRKLRPGKYVATAALR
jgi:hypothetical protein